MVCSAQAREAGNLGMVGSKGGGGAEIVVLSLLFVVSYKYCKV